MSEYVLKIEDEPQAEALLTYLRSLDFVELLPKPMSLPSKKLAISAMTSLLADLPDQSNYTQKDVNQAVNELRMGQNGS